MHASKSHVLKQPIGTLFAGREDLDNALFTHPYAVIYEVNLNVI